MTGNLQLELDFSATTTISLFASTKFGPVAILVDEETAGRLNGRRLSLGSHGYAQLMYEGQSTLLHRWALNLKIRDGLVVDHADGNIWDCRRSNLRIVSHAQNSANRRPTGLSGILGVEAAPGGRWRVRDRSGGQTLSLGSFRDLAEAARVSDAHRRAHRPGYISRGVPQMAALTIAA